MATQTEFTPFIWCGRPRGRHRKHAEFGLNQVTSGTQKLHLALEEIWNAQQALAAPQPKLSEWVFASLNHIDTKDSKRDFGIWTDMHRSIQYALDLDFESARAAADRINDSFAPPDRRNMALSARLVAHFFCGLLEVARFDHVLLEPRPAPTDLAAHIAKHHAAQYETWQQIQLMSQSGVKPPKGLQSISVLIQFLINVLYGDGTSLAGYLHVVRTASINAEFGEESLFVYGLTQLLKGRLDRAQFCFAECQEEALRSGNRLLAALAGAELAVLETLQRPDEAHHSRSSSVEKALQIWMTGPSSAVRLDDKNKRASGYGDAKREQRLLLAVNYIEKNMSTRVTTEVLAAHCGVAARTISEDFRVAFQKTTLSYITDVRMSMALKLLKEQSLPIEEVARRVGFQSLLGFNKAFLRTYGSLPLALSRMGQ